MRICIKCGNPVTHTNQTNICINCRKSKGYSRPSLIKPFYTYNEGKEYKEYNPDFDKNRSLWTPTAFMKSDIKVLTMKERQDQKDKLNKLLRRNI